jgi:pimeloyl-ACP methyl ester carboxylesterase
MAVYVLVHGGWHGAWCWDKVTPLLRAAGHQVYAPTLTGLAETAHLLTADVGLDTHIQDVVGLLGKEDLHQIILVGHSYSGMVITGVADCAPDRIGLLVYLDAVVPQDGQSLADTQPLVISALRREANKHGDGWRVDPPRARPAFLGGLFGITQEPDLSMVRSKVTAQPLKTFTQPLRMTNQEAVSSIPHTFIQTTGGGPIYSFMRRTFMRVPDEPGWRIRRLKTGHDAMIIAPRELADLLLELA